MQFAKAVQTIPPPNSTKRKSTEPDDLHASAHAPTPGLAPVAPSISRVDKGKTRAVPVMESTEISIDDELLEVFDGTKTPSSSQRSTSRPPPSTSAPDASRLPRTIYLNLDFPMPARDWDGVFDSWVQGDVQTWAREAKNALEDEDKRIEEERERKEREKERRRLDKEEKEKRALEKENEKMEIDKREREAERQMREKAPPPKKRKGAKGAATGVGGDGTLTKKPRSLSKLPSSTRLIIHPPTRQMEDVEMASPGPRKPPSSKKPKPSSPAKPKSSKPLSTSSLPPRPQSERAKTLRRYSSMQMEVVIPTRTPCYSGT